VAMEENFGEGELICSGDGGGTYCGEVCIIS